MELLYGKSEEEKNNRIINENSHNYIMGVFILKNILTITMVIIGSIIGAGFASGQEINSFFYKYGIIGILGIIISIFLISLIIYKVFLIIENENINNYKNFLEIIFENKKTIKNNKLKINNKKNNFKLNNKIKNKIKKIITKNNYKKINKLKITNNENKYLNISYITNLIINIFLIISFFIMVAGFGAYFNQEYNMNAILGSSVLAGICLIIFMNNIEGVIKINKYLIPILIFFMFIIGIKNINNFNLIEINNKKIINNYLPSIISGIIYASYNIILLIPVLITLKNKIKKNNIFLISIFSGIVLFILSLIIYFLLINIKIDINKIEMPAVYVIGKYFPEFKKMYEFIILTSILTTAISEGISVLENVCKNKKSYTQLAAILCITSVIFSKIGFSNLINLLYPIFGVLGYFQIYIILKYKIKNNKK